MFLLLPPPLLKRRLDRFFLSSESQITTTHDSVSLLVIKSMREMDQQLTFLPPGAHVPGGRQNCRAIASFTGNCDAVSLTIIIHHIVQSTTNARLRKSC